MKLNPATTSNLYGMRSSLFVRLNAFAAYKMEHSMRATMLNKGIQLNNGVSASAAITNHLYVLPKNPQNSS
jgi:hypothetical protein